jgi:hypothetical protein
MEIIYMADNDKLYLDYLPWMVFLEGSKKKSCIHLLPEDLLDFLAQHRMIWQAETPTVAIQAVCVDSGGPMLPTTIFSS